MTKQRKIKLHMDNESGLVYKDVTHHISNKAELSRYLTHNNQLSDPRYYQYQKSVYDDFISRFIKGSILDYGCGEEAPLKSISGLDMACYDLYFFKDPKVLENKYDSIIMVEVIEHFRSPFDEFEMLVNRLNPKGRLIIQTEFKPNYDSIHTWWYIRDETHLSFFDEQVFQFLAKKHGLNVIFSNQKNRIVLEKA